MNIVKRGIDIPSPEDYPELDYALAVARAYSLCATGLMSALALIENTKNHIEDGGDAPAILKSQLQEFLNHFYE